MKKTIKATLILAFIASLAGVILSQVKEVTQPQIAKQAKEKQLSALAVVLPNYKIIDEKTTKIDGTDFKYWQGQNDKKEIGYAFLTSGKGYGGDVISMVGVDKDFKILGISILQQSETPGLGARCTEIASDETFWSHFFSNNNKKSATIQSPWFEQQFAGLNPLEKINVVKKGDWNQSLKESLLNDNAITAITGATITSKTISDSVIKGTSLLQKVISEQ